MYLLFNLLVGFVHPAHIILQLPRECFYLLIHSLDEVKKLPSPLQESYFALNFLHFWLLHAVGNLGFKITDFCLCFFLHLGKVRKQRLGLL